MFPGVENPTFSDKYETFRELAVVVDIMDVTFNQIQSWCITDYPEDGHLFHLTIFMPRLSQTIYWQCPVDDIEEIERWIETKAKPRILAWYGLN